MRVLVFIAVSVSFTISSVFSLFEGDECIVSKTKLPGKCVYIHQCQHAISILKQYKRPTLCGFNRSDPIVCCPVNQRLNLEIPGRKSKKMCADYHDVERFRNVPQVTHGEPVPPKELPHMAAVGYGNESNIFWLCGGTIISNFFILSAAHCVISRDFGPATRILLGNVDLKNSTDDPYPVGMGIKKSFTHPDYKRPSHYHDIALFQVDWEISLSLNTNIACLHTERNIPVNSLQAAAWGKLSFWGESSSRLMKVNLTIVDHETCDKKYSGISTRRLAHGIDDQYQICAGDASGGDTCRPGDSGGPLYFKPIVFDNDISPHFVVVGITSFGTGCEGENTVFVRVSSYVGWIESIIFNESFLQAAERRPVEVIL